MSRRRGIVAVITGSCLALGGVTSEAVAPAVGASGATTATAPQQLVHAVSPGSAAVVLQRTDRFERDDQLNCAEPLCATRPCDASARTGADSGEAGWPRRVRCRVGRAPDRLRRRGRGSSLPAAPRRTGRAGERCRPRTWIPRSASSAALERNGSRRECYHRQRPAWCGTRWDRSPAPPAAASDAEEREFRRLDDEGDAGGAFNLGVVLHQRGDLAGATAAYERAEERGDPDAAFNLGVLLYEAGDLDGAEAAWRRSAGRGHVRAAANLLFLSRHRRESEARPSDPVRGAGTRGVRRALLPPC